MWGVGTVWKGEGEKRKVQMGLREVKENITIQPLSSLITMN